MSDDKEFLNWIHQRLEHQHGENPNADFMLRFKSIIDSMPEKNDKELSKEPAQKVVHKFTLLIKDEQTIKMPVGTEILSIQNQHDSLCIWALVDTQQSQFQLRTFRIYGTGHPIEVMNGHDYIGSVQFDGGFLVWHVFEINQMPF